jgi:energy-converting hydrogenase A subunit H
MYITSLGGDFLGIIPLGDIVLYLTPFHLFMCVVMLLFTFLICISRTETQVEASFGKLEDTKVSVGLKEFKQRRFLSVICGIATAGAMITGDLFNFTLFMALIGIVNIGIVSAVKQSSVLNSAYQYGLIAMMCSLPLFGGAAIILASTGTLSLFELSNLTTTTSMTVFGALLLLIGILGESGVAPFFATKAEMFRTPGSPFLVIIHLSSLFVVIRAIEILLIIIKVI